MEKSGVRILDQRWKRYDVHSVLRNLALALQTTSIQSPKSPLSSDDEQRVGSDPLELLLSKGRTASADWTALTNSAPATDSFRSGSNRSKKNKKSSHSQPVSPLLRSPRDSESESECASDTLPSPTGSTQPNCALASSSSPASRPLSPSPLRSRLPSTTTTTINSSSSSPPSSSCSSSSCSSSALSLSALSSSASATASSSASSFVATLRALSPTKHCGSRSSRSRSGSITTNTNSSTSNAQDGYGSGEHRLKSGTSRASSMCIPDSRSAASSAASRSPVDKFDPDQIGALSHAASAESSTAGKHSEELVSPRSLTHSSGAVDDTLPFGAAADEFMHLFESGRLFSDEYLMPAFDEANLHLMQDWYERMRHANQILVDVAKHLWAQNQELSGALERLQCVVDAQEAHDSTEKNSRRVPSFATMTRRRPKSRFNMRRSTTEPADSAFSLSPRSSSEHDIAGRLNRGRHERSSRKSGQSRGNSLERKQQKETKKRTSSAERSGGTLSPRGKGSSGKRKEKSSGASKEKSSGASKELKSPPTIRRRAQNPLERSSVRPDSSSPTYLDPQRNQLHATIPKRMVATPCVDEPLGVLQGPEDREYGGASFLGEDVCAISVSTYPWNNNQKVRCGTPIADHYEFAMYKDAQVAVLADGCGWGEDSASAAQIASAEFLRSVSESLPNIADTRDAGYILLAGIQDAQRKLMQSAPSDRRCGTTTLFGCVLLNIKASSISELVEQANEYLKCPTSSSAGAYTTLQEQLDGDLSELARMMIANEAIGLLREFLRVVRPTARMPETVAHALTIARDLCTDNELSGITFFELNVKTKEIPVVSMYIKTLRTIVMHVRKQHPELCENIEAEKSSSLSPSLLPSSKAVGLLDLLDEEESVFYLTAPPQSSPAQSAAVESNFCNRVAVCVGIGDCKAFRYSRREEKVIEISRGNRIDVKDATDPGGRLGSYHDDGAPDLRNLQCYYAEVEDGDLVWIVSDGIHDNWNPIHLGAPVKRFRPSDSSWDDVPSSEITRFVYTHSLDLQTEQVLKCIYSPVPPIRLPNCGSTQTGDWHHTTDEAPTGLTPRALATRLIQYAVDVTQTTRKAMEATQKRLPRDYQAYPGKLDHSTILCMRAVSTPNKPNLAQNQVQTIAFTPRNASSAYNSACVDAESSPTNPITPSEAKNSP